jgi:NAD-dependent dihydropyrimidine dehydrogenase PreA subunit
MRPHFINRSKIRTPYVQLNTKTCSACWKCLEECPCAVIGKIDLPWHKHAIFENPRDCSGCFTCIKECDSGAMTETTKNGKKDKRETIVSPLFINLNLIIVSAAMIFSGFLLQIGYHMGNHGAIPETILYFGLDYSGWSVFHKISIVIFSVLMIFHTVFHWKWYSIVLSKKLISKNISVLILTTLFVMVALTGYFSWFIHLTNGLEILRKIFIELHDKLTLFLFIFLLLHVAGRLKWFIKSGKRMSKQN